MAKPKKLQQEQEQRDTSMTAAETGAGAVHPGMVLDNKKPLPEEEAAAWAGFELPTHPLVQREPGVSPVVISAPHGGQEKPKELVDVSSPRAGSSPQGDLYTDEMAFTLHEKANALFTSVVALGARNLADLNSSGTGLHSKLVDYYRAYHASITDSILEAGERHGFAILLDLHGYRDDPTRVWSAPVLEVEDDAFVGEDYGDDPYYDAARDLWVWPATATHQEQAQIDINIEPGTIYFGTGFGRHIPDPCVEDYYSFQQDLVQAGYAVSPVNTFEEHGAFFGGHSVNLHGNSDRYRFPVLAIQVEVPLSIREDPEKRDRFLGALNMALQNLTTRVGATVSSTPKSKFSRQARIKAEHKGYWQDAVGGISTAGTAYTSNKQHKKSKKKKKKRAPSKPPQGVLGKEFWEKPPK